MVLVRKSELACRNGFDQDLWELASQPVDLQSSTHIPLPMSGSDHPNLPTVQAEVSESRPQVGEMFTDRITSISMPTRSQLRPVRADIDEAIDEDAEIDSIGARTSVREARKRRQEQRTLERKQHQEVVLQRADDLLETGNPSNPIDVPVGRLRAVDGPLTVAGSARPTPERRQSPAESVNPDADHHPLQTPIQSTPRARHASPQHESIEFGATPPRFRGGSTPAPDSVKPRGNDSPSPPSKQSKGMSGDTAFKRLETEPLPNLNEVQAAVQVRQERPGRDGGSPERHNGAGRSTPATRAEQSRRQAPRIDLPPAVESRPTNWITGAGNIPNEASATLPVPLAVDPIDGSKELQTVRRCCATCRDFKQVGDGRTGWCTNPYAFSEKRMVQSNELACSSSIGVWWLPNDDRWLELADTSHHGRPTPLLDELIGIKSDERRD